MGKAILAMIVTFVSGFIGIEIFSQWPEFGCIIATAVMGAFIIYFNEKKK